MVTLPCYAATFGPLLKTLQTFGKEMSHQHAADVLCCMLQYYTEKGLGQHTEVCIVLLHLCLPKSCLRERD